MRRRGVLVAEARPGRCRSAAHRFVLLPHIDAMAQALDVAGRVEMPPMRRDAFARLA